MFKSLWTPYRGGCTKTIQRERIQSLKYSTSLQDLLSFSSTKVQKYLKHLQNSYLKAVEQADKESMRTVRNLKPVIDLLNEVSLAVALIPGNVTLLSLKRDKWCQVDTA